MICAGIPLQLGPCGSDPPCFLGAVLGWHEVSLPINAYPRRRGSQVPFLGSPGFPPPRLPGSSFKVVDPFELEPIGVLRTCFPEKLGIPRQPGLAPRARGVLRFSPSQPPEVWRHALDGLSGFSHVWLTFSFHKAAAQGWKPRIRPPRLDGREKIGVFATRSPHRPNFLGLSLCRLELVDLQTPTVVVSGVDILDGTPILDLRPFHPENDVPVGSVLDGWLQRAAVHRLTVEWTPLARTSLCELLPQAIAQGYPQYDSTEAMELVDELVSLDPRPAHLRGADGSWYMRVLSFDVVVEVDSGRAFVREVRP